MQQFILTAGYAAIFVLMLAESACVPVPSEITMPLGGAVAAGAVSGAQLNIVLVVVVGTAGNVAGSYIAWGVGRYAGPQVVRKWGRFLRFEARDIDRAEQWFARYGAASVFFGRLLPVVRTFISLPAGFAAMPAGRFGGYTVAGCLPWTAALAGIGYALGAHWSSVSTAFHGPTYAIVVVVIVVTLVLMWRRRGAVASRPDEAKAAQAEGAGQAVRE